MIMEVFMGVEIIVFACVLSTVIVGSVYFVMHRNNQDCVNNNNELKIQLTETNEILKKSQERLKDIDLAKMRADTLAERIPSLESQIHKTQQDLVMAKSDVAELTAKLASEKKQSQEKLTLLNDAKDQLKSEFENLAQNIFESKSKKFTDQNKDNISTLLNPLKDQIEGFRKRVDDVYEKDSNGRSKLIHEIEQLKNLNKKISEDAMSLTNALRGDNKTQGNWGEMVLENLLEKSGLRKGHEYEVQGTFRNEEGKMLRPDVVLHLPEGKDIVIDSKVSLRAHDEVVNAIEFEEQEMAMKRLVISIRSHIKELRSKNYDHIPELRTLDYVFMFVPIDGVYTSALEADPSLFQDTMDHNIMVVTPSTLMLALKTIHNIWRYENQNENALEIAKRGGDLYDKFVMFTESLTDIGTRLGQAQDAYDTARNRLVNGRGNLISRTEQLKELGANTKKSLPESLISQSRESSLINSDDINS